MPEQTPDPREDGPLAAWLATVRAYESAARLMERRLAADGLSIAKFDTLAAVATLGRATQQAVADQMVVSKAGLATMLARLERDGLVERSPDPADARTRLVALTERGHAALGTALAHQALVVRRTVRALPEHDQRQLRRIMDALGAAVDGVDSDAG